MKEIKWEGDLPPCDWCKSPGCSVYNTPTKLGPWANLCGPCFGKIGINTSVTEKRVLEPTSIPAGGWGVSQLDGSIVSEYET